MNNTLKTFVSRLLSCVFASAFVLLTAQAVFAAEEEEEGVADPVWVLSYAAFILFSGVVVMVCMIFSKRRETALDMEQQKIVGKVKTERLAKRRKERQYERIHAQKKK